MEVMSETRSFVEEDVCIILIVSIRNSGLHLSIVEQVP